MVFLLHALTLLFLILPITAGAATLLIFKSGDNDLRVRSMADFLLKNDHITQDLPYQTAQADLNGDGVNETIFRQISAGCEMRADCLHLIAGISAEKTPILITSLKARKVGMADEKAYGVRDLFVYNRQHDDFTYETFAWNPRKPGYAPK